MVGQPCVVYLLVLLTVLIAHLCWCARLANYYSECKSPFSPPPRSRADLRGYLSACEYLTSLFATLFLAADTLENEKFCHVLKKKFTHEIRNATAAIVRSSHMFDRWEVNSDRHCRFVFKTARGEGLFAVIHRMFFRRNGSQCVDYVKVSERERARTLEFYTESKRLHILLFHLIFLDDKVIL